MESKQNQTTLEFEVRPSEAAQIVDALNENTKTPSTENVRRIILTITTKPLERRFKKIIKYADTTSLRWFSLIFDILERFDKLPQAKRERSITEMKAWRENVQGLEAEKDEN